ncbi:MAG: glycosyltransferase [Alphaproteobacteria bacterium]|nr:glycosyltransferase [Alphaproteobacteria bacterium]
MAGAAQGGAEEFFVRLCTALHRAGVAQHVVMRPQAERAAALRAAGLDPKELRFGGRLDLTTRRRFRAEVDAFRPDVVLTWMNRATEYCPSPDATRKRFVHAARLGGYYNLKYYKRCDHLIANTQGIAEYLCVRGWPAERVHYLPNFVRLPAAEPHRRDEFDTPDDAPLLLAAGRLHMNKAFDVLLRAMRELPDCHLWLAGTGPMEATLRRLAAELKVIDRVRFLGWQRDMAALYGAADVFVCPSRQEPLGNVIVEAWSARLPVVAAAAAGPLELIDDGRSGFLVPIDDAGALATGIRKMLDHPDLRRKIARGGRAGYEKSFTEEKVVGHYLKFFDQITGR